MNILSSSLYAVVIMGCVLCSFVIRTSSAPRMPRWYLTAYLVLQSGAFAFQWLMLHPTSPGKSLWLGSLMSLSLLLAPCLWLYAREITESTRPTVRSMSAAFREYAGVTRTEYRRLATLTSATEVAVGAAGDHSTVQNSCH